MAAPTVIELKKAIVQRDALIIRLIRAVERELTDLDEAEKGYGASRSREERIANLRAALPQ